MTSPAGPSRAAAPRARRTFAWLSRLAVGARSGAAGVAIGVLTWAVLTGTIVTAPTSSAQAADSSAVTVTAQQQDPDYQDAPFPSLSVTVSQTQDLIDQGIQVSWTGAKQTDNITNFLQIFMCWGDDPSDHSQPDRTTCEYGGYGGTYSYAGRSGVRASGSVAAEDASYTVPGTSVFNPTYTSIPFRSVTGDTVADVVDGATVPGVDVNNNQFFTKYTSNEVPKAVSGVDGSGTIHFEVQTAARSAGLGCGTPSGAGESAIGSSCWLVIVPRGTADVGRDSIYDSGLFWDTWKHHLAVRLDFRPVGAHCAIGAVERQLSGSELLANAVQSWQPKLCGATGGSTYSHLTLAESDAVQAAADDATAPLALTSRPLAVDSGVSDPLVYAPIAVTGITIAFAIDRQPFASAPADVLAELGLPFTTMKLTPRLVAKLLTYSYVNALPDGADKSEIGWKSISDPGPNARNLTDDPDFLAINDPEWQYEGLVNPALGDLLLPQGRSDAAIALWDYVLADADARAFLDGQPDPWGMKVNPWYSTNPAINPNGSPLELPRDNYPKADPIEKPGSGGADPVNLVTWRPYTNDYDTSGRLVLQGDGQELNAWDPFATPPKYTKTDRRLAGTQRVLGLTTLGAASRYQLYTAELRNPAGEYVAPSIAGLVAAAAAMTPSPTQPAVVGFDPTSDAAKAATDAYPLSLPVYAAARTDIPDSAERQSYAAFIQYAVGAGQQPGNDEGQLPDGYAPIPSTWAAAATSAAAKIAAGPSPAPTATPAPTSSSNDSPPASSGGTTQPSGPSTAPQEPPQPSATGSAAPALSAGTTPADPAGGSSPAVAGGLLSGVGATAVSAIAGRRKAIRAWARR